MTSPYALPEWAAFLARIRANPADDLPRLVAADWLEEHGEAGRAEFIRVQCQVERTEGRFFTDCVREGDVICSQINEQLRRMGVRGQEWCRGCRPRVRLLERESQLWQTVGPTLARARWVVTHDPFRFDGSREQPGALVRRGFVAEVRCTIADWCGARCHHCDGGYFGHPRHGVPDCPVCDATGWERTGIGPGVARSHPVEVVGLTDTGPVQNRVGGWFWPAGRSVEHSVPLPAYVWRMPQITEGGRGNEVARLFSTPEDAHTAASAALIAWALAQPVEQRP